jgi:hypothetical protein
VERIAITQITLAKYRARELVFTKEEQKIYDLSKAYDSIRLKYLGKKSQSLPKKPEIAKRDANWKHFKKLYDFLEKEQIHLETYLKIQFKVFERETTKNTLKLKELYPCVLTGDWCLNNYLWYVKDCKEKGIEIDRTEEGQVRLVFKSNFEMINNSIINSIEKVPNLFHVIMLSESLSPLFLATDTEYLRYVNKSEADVPDDLVKVLTRMNKDVAYKNMVIRVRREIGDE